MKSLLISTTQTNSTYARLINHTKSDLNTPSISLVPRSLGRKFDSMERLKPPNQKKGGFLRIWYKELTLIKLFYHLSQAFHSSFNLIICGSQTDAQTLVLVLPIFPQTRKERTSRHDNYADFL
jgi:hypothetical protein